MKIGKSYDHVQTILRFLRKPLKIQYNYIGTDDYMVLVFVYVTGSGVLQLQNLLSYEFSLLINTNIQIGEKLSILRHTFLGTFFS